MHRRPECEALLAEISEYVDGAAEPEVCAEIERHLTECPDCTVVVHTLRKTVVLYRRSAEEADLPVGLRSRLFRVLHLDDLLPGGIGP